MRDLPCPARIPCRLGSRFQRAQNNQPPGNADAVFDVSIRGPALDRPARRAEAARSLRAASHVTKRKRGNKTRAEQVSVAMTHIAVSNESEQGQKSSVCLAWVRETDLKASVVLAAPGLGFSP